MLVVGGAGGVGSTGSSAFLLETIQTLEDNRTVEEGWDWEEW